MKKGSVRASQGYLVWGRTVYKAVTDQKDVRDRVRVKSCQRRRDASQCIEVAVPIIIDQGTFDRTQERL